MTLQHLQRRIRPRRAGEQLAKPRRGATPQVVQLHGQVDQLFGWQAEQR
jgi:hypothetical protein